MKKKNHTKIRFIAQIRDPDVAQFRHKDVCEQQSGGQVWWDWWPRSHFSNLCLFVAYENKELPARSAVSHGGRWLLSTRRLITAALNETHMHKVDILYVGPEGKRARSLCKPVTTGSDGRDITGLLFPDPAHAPGVSTSVRDTGVSPPPGPGHHRHGSRHGCNFNLSGR